MIPMGFRDPKLTYSAILTSGTQMISSLSSSKIISLMMIRLLAVSSAGRMDRKEGFSEDLEVSETLEGSEGSITILSSKTWETWEEEATSRVFQAHRQLADSVELREWVNL